VFRAYFTLELNLIHRDLCGKKVQANQAQILEDQATKSQDRLIQLSAANRESG